jgi:Recombination endonuclease VII
VTRPEALAVAAARGWTIRRDARRRGGWYVRTPQPRVAKSVWAAMLKSMRGRCPLCRRRATLVKDHSHRTGRIRWPICNLCNLALGHLGRAGVRGYWTLMRWATRAGAVVTR